jgi:DNA processing protein
MSDLRKVKGLTEPCIRSLVEKNFDWVNELTEIEKLGIKIIDETSTDWPQSLQQLWDPPLILYVDGHALPNEKSVAIIGSRHCSPYGTYLAHHFAQELAKLGWWIISGMARGIDLAAHEGALSVDGKTAAILGHGINLTYPPEAVSLRKRISEKGCLVSEFPLGRPADRQSFPQRNRLVAGLVKAVIIIETDTNGGSMITARFAGDLGKTLLTVPGRIDSATSRGCHQLIREGATLVSSLDDILSEIGEQRGQLNIPFEQMAPEDNQWLKYFRGGTIHDAESLSLLANCTLADAASALTLMELQGKLKRRTDGRHER